MPTRAEMQAYANQQADAYGIPRDLFSAMIRQESEWNPDAVSSAGAYGLGQLMPGTASDLGVDRTDWRQNLRGAADYLSQQYKRFGDWALALSAYNSGPGGSEKYGKIEGNSETQSYVERIFGMLGDAAADAAFDLSPFGAIPGLDGSDIMDNAKTGVKATVETFDNWKDAVLAFFSKDTLIRGVAIVLGLALLIAAVATFVGGSKVAAVVKTVNKIAA